MQRAPFRIGSGIGAAAGRYRPESREWDLGGSSCRGPLLLYILHIVLYTLKLQHVELDLSP
jgi:hypothetical protein